MLLTINGEEREFAGDQLTLAALIEQLGMKADRVAVELNRAIVSRDQWAATQLNSGDKLEIVHFVGGGSGHPRPIHRALFAGGADDVPLPKFVSFSATV
jgi:thiamine biosynthesis protein ThiS